MTDSDFEDAADFDINDISSIMKDIDNANLALDVMDGRLAQTCICRLRFNYMFDNTPSIFLQCNSIGRADRLKANILSLLQAQSQLNPYTNLEPEVPQSNANGPASTATSSVGAVLSVDKQDTPQTPSNSTTTPTAPSAASSHSVNESSTSQV